MKKYVIHLWDLQYNYTRESYGWLNVPRISKKPAILLVWGILWLSSNGAPCISYNWPKRPCILLLYICWWPSHYNNIFNVKIYLIDQGDLIDIVFTTLHLSRYNKPIMLLIILIFNIKNKKYKNLIIYVYILVVKVFTTMGMDGFPKC